MRGSRVLSQGVQIQQRFFFLFLFDEGIGSKCGYKWAIIGPPEKRHAFRWRADDGLKKLNAGMVAL